MKLSVYQRRLAAIRARTADQAARRWDDFNSYNEDDVAPFVRDVSPLIAAGQFVAAGVVNAYVARIIDQPVVRMSVDQVVGAAVRNGTSLDEVYRRPFTSMWKQLSDGASYEDAQSAGRLALIALANTDVWLATRAATTVIERVRPAIKSWVRAADADACTECANADGMSLAEAADLAGHPNCGCTSIPVTSEDDDSQAVDAEAVQVEHDDELGPMLRPAS